MLPLATPGAGSVGPHRPGQSQTGAVTRRISSGCRIRCTTPATKCRAFAAATRRHADRLQTQLDELRDEVVYLRVKMRKEGTVSRSDYTDVRTQVESRARGSAR